MEDLQILIQKYWAGTATEKEEKLLWELLDTQEPLLKDWLAAEYSKGHASTGKRLSEVRSLEILRQIQEKKQRHGAVSPYRVGWTRIGVASRWIIGVAASVILLIAGIALFRYDRHNDQNRPGTAFGKNQLQEPLLQRISNPGLEEMRLVLSDSSVVVLQPHSAISYYAPFDPTKRDISLSGKALFKVAGDRARPFTVYAGAIATTALGTQFIVSTLSPGRVEVKLLEGRVRVSPAGGAFSMKDVFLQPGQEFSLDTLLRQFTVRSFTPEGPSPRRMEKATAHPSALTFDRELLTGVFEKVQAQYDVHFIYNKEDVRGLRFSGTFLPSDSLPVVLAVICNMNDLTFRRDNKNIIISKGN
jgi:ferric-dicitrate binding protein FerR (iron transport regulator)